LPHWAPMVQRASDGVGSPQGWLGPSRARGRAHRVSRAVHGGHDRAPHSAVGAQMRNRPTRRSRSRDALSGSLLVARRSAPRSTGKSRIRNDPPGVVVEPGKCSVVADRQLARVFASTGLCCSRCGSDRLKIARKMARSAAAFATAFATRLLAIRISVRPIVVRCSGARR